MNSIAQSARHEDPELRFAFGRAWRSFLTTLDERRIDGAQSGLCESTGRDDLHGLRAPDIGSGSSLSSPAMHQLGADVAAFDYETDSIACLGEPDRPYVPSAMHWQFRRGSASNPTIRNMDDEPVFKMDAMRRGE